MELHSWSSSLPLTSSHFLKQMFQLILLQVTQNNGPVFNLWADTKETVANLKQHILPAPGLSNRVRNARPQ